MFRLIGENKEDYGLFVEVVDAQDYAEEFELGTDYEIHCQKTGDIILSIDLPIEVWAKVKQAAEEKGLSIQEFFNVVIKEHLEELRRKAMITPEMGQIWKYKDSEDLYMISYFDFSSCQYNTLTSLSGDYKGHVGPIWENLKEMTRGMEFVAETIEDILIPSIKID